MSSTNETTPEQAAKDGAGLRYDSKEWRKISGALPAGVDDGTLLQTPDRGKERTMDEKVLFRLVEKTAGPWHGKVWRCEEMTQAAADAVNARITVMQWERCKGENKEAVAEAKPRRRQ